MAGLLPKLKEVEAALSVVRPFAAPRVELEQYPTSAHLAARLLFAAHGFGDVEERSVLDLGCGTGMLGLAAELLGAAQVVGVDIDPGALRIAARNKARLFAPDEDEDEDEQHEALEDDDEADDGADDGRGEPRSSSCLELVQADVLSQSFPLALGGRDGPAFDTVVTNPPFGTRNKGADVGFLQAGLALARNAVYSLHKSSTRDFLQRKATKEWGVGFAVVAELRFDIPKMYDFHKKKSADVAVDLIRLWRKKP
jgi:predicted RNA methylase